MVFVVHVNVGSELGLGFGSGGEFCGNAQNMKVT